MTDPDGQRSNDAHPGIDALMPQAMALRAEEVGVAKARLDF
ncbi:MAG: hypothetical protein O7A65_02320 [Proteobacteria bacterium]|nr:hypothetical protein [Pseudomonadota bacterium]